MRPWQALKAHIRDVLHVICILKLIVEEDLGATHLRVPRPDLLYLS